MLLIALLVALATAGDFGMIGLESPEAGRLLALLIEAKHRVAAFDVNDPALAKAFMRKGAISSFSEEAVVQFATPVVILASNADLRKLWNQVEARGKVFVIWGRPKDEAEVKELEDAASVKGCSVAWGVFRNDQGIVTGKAKVMQIPGVARLVKVLADSSSVVDVDDDATLKRRDFAPCPEQKPGPSLVVKRFSAHEMGCANTQLTVCRVYAKFADPASRLHVVALYETEGDVTTSDPEGFHHAFNNTIIPMREDMIAGIPDGRCDSWITMGVEEGSSCASPDPSFKRPPFTREGRLVKGTGWYCSNPQSPDTVPATAASPPNSADSILIAQFTVRQPHSVAGQLMVIATGPNKENLKAVQSFNCDCDY